MRFVRWAGLILFFVFSSGSLLGQLDAPGALSDFGVCGREVCTWVPELAAQKVYRRADMSYSVDGDTFELRRGNKVLLSTPLQDLSASVSVAWSPKSDWFSVTWSNGGAIGGFNTRVFHIVRDDITETSAPEKAFQEFRSRHTCKERGENLQAYRWSDDGNSLVLVMSVYPTSDCGADMGHTEAYIVRPVDGSILRHLNISQLNQYIRRHPVW